MLFMSREWQAWLQLRHKISQCMKLLSKTHTVLIPHITMTLTWTDSCHEWQPSGESPWWVQQEPSLNSGQGKHEIYKVITTCKYRTAVLQGCARLWYFKSEWCTKFKYRKTLRQKPQTEVGGGNPGLAKGEWWYFALAAPETNAIIWVVLDHPD